MNIIPVTTLDMPELSLYRETRESQLFHYLEPEPGLFLAESCVVIERALDAGYQPRSFLIEEGSLADPFVQRLCSRCALGRR